MVGARARFAATGEPTGPGLPGWRPGQVLSPAPDSATGIRPIDADAEHQCAFWRTVAS